MLMIFQKWVCFRKASRIPKEVTWQACLGGSGQWSLGKAPPGISEATGQPTSSLLLLQGPQASGTDCSFARTGLQHHKWFGGGEFFHGTGGMISLIEKRSWIPGGSGGRGVSFLVAALCYPQHNHTHPSLAHGWRQSASGEQLTW